MIMQDFLVRNLSTSSVSMNKTSHMLKIPALNRRAKPRLTSIRWPLFGFCTGWLFILALAGMKLNAATVWLDDLDVTPTVQGWGDPHKNQSIDGHGLSIGGQSFKHGLG